MNRDSDGLNPASFCVLEPEMLIATVRLPTGRMTPSDASYEEGAPCGVSRAIFVLGCLAIVITAVLIAYALATSG